MQKMNLIKGVWTEVPHDVEAITIMPKGIVRYVTGTTMPTNDSRF